MSDTSSASSTSAWGAFSGANWGTVGSGGNNSAFDIRNGFDLILRQENLQARTAEIEASIAAIESNANLSDTERMYAMQMAMNTWSAVTNLRTNMMKTVSDTLKAIVRNVA